MEMTKHGGPKKHPERPDRLTAIYSRLRMGGLVPRMRNVAARDATDEEVCLVHSAKHLEHIRETASWFEEGHDGLRAPFL